jgi:hypothetical protein
LKPFPIYVSVAAVVFAVWHSNAVLGRQSLAKMPFRLAYLFNRFIFLHPLKQFPDPVSLAAGGFRL